MACHVTLRPGDVFACFVTVARWCVCVKCEDGVDVVGWRCVQDIVLCSSPCSSSVLVVWFGASVDRLGHHAAGLLLWSFFPSAPSTSSRFQL